MTGSIRLLVLGVAAAVHLAALAVVHAAMVQTTLQEKLARQQPARILVTAPHVGQRMLATQSCPAPKG